MVQAKEPKKGYQRVTDTYIPTSDSRRHAPYVQVETTGAAFSSTTATEMVLPLVAANGQYPDNFHLAYDVNLEAGTVALTVVSAYEPGANPAKVSKDRRRITFHLGAVFRKYPKLAAPYTRKCRLLREDDGTLVIAVMAGTAYQKAPVDEAIKAARAEVRAAKRAQKAAQIAKAIRHETAAGSEGATE